MLASRPNAGEWPPTGEKTPRSSSRPSCASLPTAGFLPSHRPSARACDAAEAAGMRLDAPVRIAARAAP